MSENKMSAESEMYFLRRILLSDVEEKWQKLFQSFQKSHDEALNHIETELRSTTDMLSDQLFKHIETLEKRVHQLEQSQQAAAQQTSQSLEHIQVQTSSTTAQLREEMLNLKNLMTTQLAEHKKSLQREVARKSLEAQLVVEETQKEKANAIGKPEMAQLFSDLVQKLSID